MGRIALCGVFDIPNYGDHLFPLVLREELSRRGYAGNVVLFSPFQAEESFVENSNVHSLDDLERMHMEEPFSAIVVGGGEIIHWHRFGQKRTFNSTDFEAYPMDKVWLVPCFMKMKYNVPLLWNAPGIPFDFDADKALAHYLFSNIDYLSVRNDFSKQVLIDCGIPDAAIQRVPDTGFSLKNVATDQELHDARNHVFPGLAHYAVFHCNRFIPESEINNVVATLKELHDDGHEIVLLPLAYTHGDEDILHTIHDACPFPCLIPQHPLSLLEIIGILSDCEIYVGTSLHGSVTASVFGRKTVSFDYQQTKQTRDLYHQLGRDAFYVTDGNQLAETVSDALQTQQPVDFFDTQQQLNQHFDKLFALITQGNIVTPNPSSQATQFSDLVQKCFDAEYRSIGLSQRIDELDTALEKNEGFVNYFKPRAEYFESELNKQLNRVHELEELQQHPVKIILQNIKHK